MILTVKIRPVLDDAFELAIDEYDVSVVCRDMNSETMMQSVLNEIRELILFKQELDDHFLNIGGNTP